MSLLPQAILPSISGDILFTIIAAAICGGAGTEASSPNRHAAEVDATSAGSGGGQLNEVGTTSASCACSTPRPSDPLMMLPLCWRAPVCRGYTHGSDKGLLKAGP